MILDLVVASLAFDLASAAGPGDTADLMCTPDPELDGAHLIVHCYAVKTGTRLDQLLTRCTRLAQVPVNSRGVIVLNRAGRAGITVGRGYVVEPAGGIYALTLPEPTRWVAAYAPPTLVQTSVIE